MDVTENTPNDNPTAVDSNLSTAAIGEHTQLAAPLTDSEGREISAEELKNMLGADSEKTIGVLKDMTTIGMGGIGTVFSARDTVLNREIAIKILRPAYRNRLNYVASFIREARITAQIDHPNVIPVHRLGVFDDAGAYFTMKRIRGITLATILRRLQGGNEEALKVYTRQRLLEIFVSICNGVAFAHSKGIIHRDLKPSNIMVGDYGEVFIADWGLAIYREENDNSHSSGKIQLGLLPDEPLGDPANSEGNTISGTPAFMAPEQVTGKDDELDAQIDVYALGTILYSILTWEQSPYDGVSTVSQLMSKVVQRKFLRPRRRAPKRKIPIELEAITLKAMQQDKTRRYATVIDLLNDIRNYQGKYPVSAYSPLWYRFCKLIRRRPLVPVTLLAAVLTLAIWNGSEALRQYLESKSLQGVIETLLKDCESSGVSAMAARNKLNEYFTRTGRTETLDDAAAMRSRYLRHSNEFNVASSNAWEKLQYMQILRGNDTPLVPLFARLLTCQIKYALAVNNQTQLKYITERVMQLPDELRQAIYREAPHIREHQQHIAKDEGGLLIRSNQKLLKLSAVRMQNIRNSSEDTAENPANHQAAQDLLVNGNNALSSGLYMITAVLADNRQLQFPAMVVRDQTEEINLQLPDVFPENMIYIPGGSFIFGDMTFDEQFAHTSLKGFFIDRSEVTIGEYLKFWKSLRDPALRERYRAWTDELNSRKLKPLWDDQGRVLVPYTEKMPVIGIIAEAAEAYCRYRSSRSKFKYRLPTALEWEKSSRGVDGREYVWGNVFMPDWACINDQPEKKRELYPAEVGSFANDRSIYGVMDLTGNARELVTNPGSFPYYTVKGGSFNLSRRFARLPLHAYTSNLSDVGFRCVAESK